MVCATGVEVFQLPSSAAAGCAGAGAGVGSAVGSGVGSSAGWETTSSGVGAGVGAGSSPPPKPTAITRQATATPARNEHSTSKKVRSPR